jgi:hypothetical protein
MMRFYTNTSEHRFYCGVDLHAVEIAHLYFSGCQPSFPSRAVRCTQCLLSEETWAPDPDNVFGAAACGHRRSKFAGVGSRERVNSQSRRTRNEAQIPSGLRGAGY